MKPISKEYYFLNEWGYFELANKPKRIRFGMDDLDLFTHFIPFVTGVGGFYWVTEAISGKRVDQWGTHNRDSLLINFGNYAHAPAFIEHVRTIIAAAVSSGNISPRYREIENVG